MCYTYLLFDNDGTIMDFDKAETIAFEQTYKKMNFDLEYSEELLISYSKCNLRWWKKLELGECSKDELVIARFEEFLQIHKLNANAELMNDVYWHYLGQNNQLIDGALDLLKKLSVNHKIFIITNGVSKTQHSRIETSPIWKYVDELFISEDTGYSKPHPKFFEYVLEKGKIQNKSDCIIIGDSLTSDIMGANNIGIDCIWYNPEHHENSSCNIQYIAHSIDDIEKILL